MIRETIAADLLAPLAPLLASLLVVLASLPAVEALRLRLAPSVGGVRRSFQPQASRGLVPSAGLSWATGSTSPDPLSSSARRPRASPVRSLPSAG
jgi:hypothetical protein